MVDHVEVKRDSVQRAIRTVFVVTAAVAGAASVIVVAASASPSPRLAYATTVTSKGPINPAAIPLGDGYLATKPKLGYVDSCITTFPGVGGAQVVGPWINTKKKTWDEKTKTAVRGKVSWKNATYVVTTTATRRIIKGNDLPINHTTGTFPIAASDPAYRYDRNPNKISPQVIDWSLPLHPTLAKKPSCTGGGPIGIVDDGVLLFNALDGEGRDAGAHEVLDSCGEHPQMDDMLHHHAISSCVLATATGASTLVGYAADGFGIYAERSANGDLLTNTNLDACHGRISRVLFDGKKQVIFHYDATLEYPYTVGCFMGTPINTGPNS